MAQTLVAISPWMDRGPRAEDFDRLSPGMVSLLFGPGHTTSVVEIIGDIAGHRHLVEGRKAAIRAVMFTTGLFVTVAAIDSPCCSLPGCMLGDIGPYWAIAIGLLLVRLTLDRCKTRNLARDQEIIY